MIAVLIRVPGDGGCDLSENVRKSDSVGIRRNQESR